MYDALDGIRVVEVAQYAFVPAAGAVLADWGADVTKVVHPEHGDVLYTMWVAGLVPLDDGTHFLWEICNRGKRSIGLDITNPDGRKLLFELVSQADVFLTNFRTPARRKLGIDVDDVRAVNDQIIYARGSGQGPLGPEADASAIDIVTSWCRAGHAFPIAQAAGKFIAQSSPGAGDVLSGFALAAGVAAALLRRERTGEPSVVDVSLLHAGLFGMTSIEASEIYDIDTIPVRAHGDPTNNGFVNSYESRDGRLIFVGNLRHDVGWEDFCTRIGRPDLIKDPRFATHAARSAHNREFVLLLEETFRGRSLEEWKVALKGAEVPWSIVQSPREALSDPQAIANGYFTEVVRGSGRQIRLTTSPVQFDQQPLEVRAAAPEPGQQTEEILLEMGKSWEEIAELKDRGAVS